MSTTLAAPPGTALRVRDLQVRFTTSTDTVHAVRGLSFDLTAGESLGIVGESGSGKSAAVLALMGLHDPARAEVTGSALLQDRELVGAPDAAMRKLRGSGIAMIFQDALAALSPFHRVGDQLEEMFSVHQRGASRHQATQRALDMLDRVGIPDPARAARQYPHQFSGGMRQRAGIAMALMNSPQVVIADEPTTALDVTIQAQVLALLDELRRDLGVSMVLITHDFGVVATTTDRTLVMFRGEKVEEGETLRLLTDPQHPYTRALVKSVPTMDTVPGSRLVTIDAQGTAPHRTTDPSHAEVSAAKLVDPGGEELLSVRGLRVSYPLRSAFLRRAAGHFHAVDDVSFDIAAGESFGLVGESGSGKSTTAQVIVGLITPTAGTVNYRGTDITAIKNDQRIAHARRVQMVFQDPYASLNPRRSVAQIIGAALRIHTDLDAAARRDRAAELLEQVGLSRQYLDRYPYQFSGGQRQRIGIARALAVGPELVVADEPVSALDVSVQAQVLNLLQDLRAELGLACLFVSHDLAVVRHFCENIAVMRAGRIVESGPREQIFGDPQHEYTRSLLKAIPRLPRT